MKVICLSHDGSRRASFNLNVWSHLIIPAGVVALLIIGLSINQMLGLYRLDNTPPQTTLTQKEAGTIISALEQQISTVDQIKKAYANYTVDVDTLSVRLGELEAEMARINSLAKRVADKAKLDPKEFSLDKVPPRGGLDDSSSSLYPVQKVSSNELLGSFQSMESQIDRQKGMLESLYQVLEGIALEQEVFPSSSPVKGGYISSGYGFRRDPFNGRSRMHKGIDYAGPRGTQIFSVAGGVVSFTGRKAGYGIVVEMDHGDGLTSRYAHLNKALVKEGEVVKKSEKIALMGSTGRSTGPHLHLEILQNGEQLDPKTYLGALAKK